MNKIVIICGPSTSGKNTIINSLFDDPKYSFSPVITNTTRLKRPTDVEGQIYHFLSEADFQSKIESGYFLEYENTHGFLYGTAKDSFNKPGNYLIQSDIRGALNIKKYFPNSLIVFINLPIEQISGRLADRGESKESVEKRLQTAKRELEMLDHADEVIDNLNGEYGKTLKNIRSAIDKFLLIR